MSDAREPVQEPNRKDPGDKTPIPKSLSTYVLAIWGRPGLERYVPAVPYRTRVRKSHLLTIWRGVDEELAGPFSSDAEIEAAAAPYRDHDHSIFRLDLEGDRPSIYYLGGEGWGVTADLLGPFEDEETLEAVAAPYLHYHHDYAIFLLDIEIEAGVSQVSCWSVESADEIKQKYPRSPAYWGEPPETFD